MTFSESIGAELKRWDWCPPHGRPSATPRISFVLAIQEGDDEAAIIDTVLSIGRQGFRDIEIIVADCARRLPSAAGLRRILRADDRLGILTPPLGSGSTTIGLGLIAAIGKAQGQDVVVAIGGFIYAERAVHVLLEGARTSGYDPGTIVAARDLGAPGFNGPFFVEHSRFRDEFRLSSLLIPRVLLVRCLPDPYAGRGIARDLVMRLFAQAIVVLADEPIGCERSGFAEDEVRHEPLARHLLRLTTHRRLRRDLTQGDTECLPVQPAGEPGDRPLVVIAGRIDSSVSLVFDPVAEWAPFDFAFVEPDLTERSNLLALLSRASLVIFSRKIHPNSENGPLLAFARALSIPLAYYIDDNFTALTAEREDLAWYTLENLRRELAAFDVVLVTSPLLKAFYDDNVIHMRVRLLSPALEKVLEPEAAQPNLGAAPGLRVAFFGGSFRLGAFKHLVLPALTALSVHMSITIITRDTVSLETALPIVALPSNRSFKEFILQWRRASPDVVIHPAGATANIDYKTSNAILCSHYLGAVPMLFDEKAYEGWDEADGIVKVRLPVVEAIEEALAQLAEPTIMAARRRSLRASVGRAYSPQLNLEVLSDLVRQPSQTIIEARYQTALALVGGRT